MLPGWGLVGSFRSFVTCPRRELSQTALFLLFISRWLWVSSLLPHDALPGGLDKRGPTPLTVEPSPQLSCTSFATVPKSTGLMVCRLSLKTVS